MPTGCGHLHEQTTEGDAMSNPLNLNADKVIESLTRWNAHHEEKNYYLNDFYRGRASAFRDLVRAGKQTDSTKENNNDTG